MVVIAGRAARRESQGSVCRFGPATGCLLLLDRTITLGAASETAGFVAKQARELGVGIPAAARKASVHVPWTQGQISGEIRGHRRGEKPGRQRGDPAAVYGQIPMAVVNRAVEVGAGPPGTTVLTQSRSA